MVSGGAGFIGTHTVRLLAQEGWQVLVIDDLRHACGEPLPPGVELERSEVSSERAVRAVRQFRPQAVLHLAAQGGVNRSLKDPAGDAQVNVIGTVALLRAAVDAGARRFVFASSGGAIYGRARRLPSREADRSAPLSPYGAAKLAAEGYLWMFARTFQLSCLALRYANVYGPYQDGTGEAGVVAITATRLLHGDPPQVTGDGSQTRDFTFVGDVARANLAGLAGRARGPVNIGTGRPTSVADLVATISLLEPASLPPEHIPARPGEVRGTYLEVSRAATLLGWRAQTALREGLRLTLSSFAQAAR